MEKLKELLQEKYPTINFDTETALVSGGLLDSMQVVELIAEIEDEFDIEVTMEYIQPAHFESVETIWAMIEELQ
ncbi:MAG: acyl carrier protein [Clostridia bacterium]|nr:acyl carrier protein [Clostridia bacterium]